MATSRTHADITQDGLIWCADISNHKSYQTGSFELNDLVTPKHSGSFSSENSSQIYFGSESGSANYLGCGNAYGITFSDGSSTNLNGRAACNIVSTEGDGADELVS